MAKPRIYVLAADGPRFVQGTEVARGGMAVIKRAHDPRILRTTAQKRLAPERLDGPLADRFLDEGRITGQLEHPNIVPVHELGIDETGAPYMDMKLVRGRTLREEVKLAGERRLAPNTLGDHLEVLLRVCDAIGYAHSRGVVHRDLKPDNIMVSDFGQVYVMDWGIAAVFDPWIPDAVDLAREPPTEPPNALIGTVAWMAPEQALAQHDRIGPATDVFQLGGLLYFLLTGSGPYSGLPREVAIRRARHGAVRFPDDPRIPEALVSIARRAMAPEPRDRYPSALAFREDLARFLRGTWSVSQVHVRAGAVFLREGEPGSTAYVIQSGRCVATTIVGGDRRVLREMGPGDVFGETAILSDGPRTASVEAVTDLDLLEIDRETLRKGLGMHSWMGVFVRALADRFRELDDRTRALDPGGHPGQGSGT